MSLNSYILRTLSKVGVPVSFEKYKGEDPTYIRFFYLPQTQFSVEDEEMYSTHYVQVDIFSPSNLLELIGEVKRVMKEAGFRKNYEVLKYEEDTDLFHGLLRFYIIREE